MNITLTSNVLFPHWKWLFLLTRDRKENCSCCVKPLLPITLWEDPATELVRVKPGPQKYDRLGWWEKKVKEWKYKSCEGRAAGYERGANSQGRGALERPGASEEEDSYFSDHLAGGPCCFKWTADKLCDVSLTNYVCYIVQIIRDLWIGLKNQICKPSCKQYKV